MTTNPLSHHDESNLPYEVHSMPTPSQTRFSLERLRESFQHGGPPALEEAIDAGGIDAALHERISGQMRDFYDFFKSLYDARQRSAACLPS